MVQIVKGILARGENVRIFTGRVKPNRARINAIRARRAIEARCKAALWAPPSSDLRRGHSSQPDAAVRQWRSYRNFATKLGVDVASGTLFWSDDKGCELARVKTRRVLIASVHPTQLENQEVTGASCRNQRVGRRSDSARPLDVMAGESAALSGGSGSSVGRSHGRKRSRGPSAKLRPSSICANTSDIGVQQPEKVRRLPAASQSSVVGPQCLSLRDKRDYQSPASRRHAARPSRARLATKKPRVNRGSLRGPSAELGSKVGSNRTSLLTSKWPVSHAESTKVCTATNQKVGSSNLSGRAI